MIPLPDKPSALIRLALSDLATLSENPRYVIDMETWHTPYKGQCMVCLSGAVMANTLGIAPNKFVRIRSLDDADVVRKLDALDSFRLGWIGDAFHSLAMGDTPFADRHIADYVDDPERFQCDLATLAADLEALGF